MKFSPLKMTLSVLAASIMAASAYAATPVTLRTNVLGSKSTTAVFAGGATLNRGASFLSSGSLAIPASVTANVPVGIQGVITPAAGDVGSEGDLFMVVQTAGKLFMRTPTGFSQWAFDGSSAAGLTSFSTKTLGATETVSYNDIATGIGQDLVGRSVMVYLGYMTDASDLNYSSPIRLKVQTPPTECPVGPASGLAPVGNSTKRLCIIEGTHTADIQLTNNFEYILSGAVFIGGDNTNSASITIDAGVKVYGESGSDFLVINRGSKIHVNGAATAPVIMTSANDATATSTTRGQWGGLIINGNAPINGCSEGTAVCEAEGEGSTGLYGGNDPADSSGNLNYLQVKYAGFEITPDNELNGIAFQAVGNGTVVDYVQVHNNSDDGVEFFGGTVNAKHLYLSGNADDSVDWTQGFKGKLQHVVVVQTDRGDQGIEADSNSNNRDSLPRAQPMISNITLIGNSNTDLGMLLREGTGANISNAVVTGFADACIDIDHSATFINAGTSATQLSGSLTITNSVVECSKNFEEEAGDSFLVADWFNNQAGNSTTAVGITSYINNSAVNALTPATQTDSFFDQTTYVGAVKDSASDWTVGWTYKD